MFRRGEISTETDKKPFFFTLAAFIGCVAAAVLMFVFGGSGLGVFAGLLCSVVGIAAVTVHRLVGTLQAAYELSV